MSKRGHPPIPVRADPALVDVWKAAAKRAGMDLSGWVRSTLNRAADPEAPAKLQAKAKQALAGLQAKPTDPTMPNPNAADPDRCPHPKGAQRVMPYGRICDRCGRLLT